METCVTCVHSLLHRRDYASSKCDRKQRLVEKCRHCNVSKLRRSSVDSVSKCFGISLPQHERGSSFTSGRHATPCHQITDPGNVTFLFQGNIMLLKKCIKGMRAVCDRDGTIALLDQMVGTTTKATARAVAAPSVNPAAQAAILAAAAVAQVPPRRTLRALA